MRKKVELNEVLSNKEIEWDEDSKIEVWERFYIPYYKHFLGKIVNFDKLTFRRGRVYRVVASVMTEGYEEIQFGGDVIINEKLLEDKYFYTNLGLLPIKGNLQGIKKNICKDKDIDIFIKKVDEYYRGENEEILKKVGRTNIEGRKKVLEFLGMNVDEDEISVPEDKRKKVYNFCKKLYGIDENTVNLLLENEDKEKNKKIFWDARQKKWEEIQNLQNIAD